MNLEQLKTFCLQVKPIRAAERELMKLTAFDGFAYATDGKIVIRVKGLTNVTPAALGEALGEWSEYHMTIARNAVKTSPQRWYRLTSPPVPRALVPCFGCNGSGQVECDACANQAACDACNGTGKRQPEVIYTLLGQRLLLQQLVRILPLPDLQLGPVPRSAISMGSGWMPQRFRFDGGEGAIMPCLPHAGAETHELQVEEV